MDHFVLFRNNNQIKKINFEEFKKICLREGITKDSYIKNIFKTSKKKKNIITDKYIVEMSQKKFKKKNTQNGKTKKEWLINKAEMLWNCSDNDCDGTIDYNYFKNNICSKYKSLDILPETIKKMLYSEIAGKDGLISKKEFKEGFFKICRNYIGIINSKEGENVEIFNNKGYIFQAQKNKQLTLGVGICLSFITGMIIMHKIKN